jgi:hypothetical protein
MLSIFLPDMKFVLLHEAKNDDGIKAFFYDVWELYLKVCAHSFALDFAPVCQPMCALDRNESVSLGPHSDSKLGVRQSSAGQCEEILVDSCLHVLYGSERNRRLFAGPNVHHATAVRIRNSNSRWRLLSPHWGAVLSRVGRYSCEAVGDDPCCLSSCSSFGVFSSSHFSFPRRFSLYSFSTVGRSTLQQHSSTALIHLSCV